MSNFLSIYLFLDSQKRTRIFKAILQEDAYVMHTVRPGPEPDTSGLEKIAPPGELEIFL